MLDVNFSVFILEAPAADVDARDADGGNDGGDKCVEQPADLRAGSLPRRQSSTDSDPAAPGDTPASSPGPWHSSPVTATCTTPARPGQYPSASSPGGPAAPPAGSRHSSAAARAEYPRRGELWLRLRHHAAHGRVLRGAGSTLRETHFRWRGKQSNILWSGHLCLKIHPRCFCLGWLRPRGLWPPSLTALAQGLGGKQGPRSESNQH